MGEINPKRKPATLQEAETKAYWFLNNTKIRIEMKLKTKMRSAYNPKVWLDSGKILYTKGE